LYINSWKLTDYFGLCGYVVLYQVYLKEIKGLDPSTGNLSYYKNASNMDTSAFREEFCSFLENGSRGFFQENANLIEREIGDRILKTIDIIRDVPIADIPSLSLPKKYWMDIG